MSTIVEAVKSKALEAEEQYVSPYAPPAARASAQTEKPVYEAGKRLLDIVLSLLGLIVLSPLFLIVAILIRREDGGPVIHTRICNGRNGAPCAMYKFRSMKTDADRLEKYFTPEQAEAYRREVKLDHDPRITRTGGFLRRTSIDELPQLVSILKGDMSIVGPRPVVDDELSNYVGMQRDLILSVRPGLTGYWQANGRSRVTYASGERQEMELYYVEHRSFWLDIKIILKTVLVVFRQEGAQ